MSGPVMMTHPVAAWYAESVLTRAAAMLDQVASNLRECRTVDDAWGNEHEARAAHDEHRHAADELRGLLVFLRGTGGGAAREPDRGDDGKGLLERAIDLVRQDGEISARTVQRTLKVDAGSAAQILAQLELSGVVDAANDDGWHKARSS
jgi:DNA segregation ATPase FtsK/SpoIIIE-like protein